MRLLAIAAFALVASVTPASAQLTRAASATARASPQIRGDILLPAPANPTIGRSASVSREVRDIREQIDAGRESGQLSRREARALRRQGYRIEASSGRYASGGYSDAEIAMLRSRTEALRSATVAKRTQGIQGK